ncbi:nucleotide-diphospho-sugar transferase [Tanacetum coccineum]
MMEVPSPLVEQTNAVKYSGESYPPLPTQGTTPAGNTSGLQTLLLVSSYESEWPTPLLLIMLGTRGNPDVDLLKEDVENVPVWVKLHGVPITEFSEDGLSAIATKLGTPIMLDSYTTDMCLQSWGRSSYGRVMIELRADMELKDNIVVAMPKNNEEVFYTCNLHVEYEWKPPRCAYCKIFGHTLMKCHTMTICMKARISLKRFKLYAISWISKFEVSDSNPFEVLYSVDNDVEVGTNGGTSNLDKNEDNSSGSSFWNVEI